MEGEGITFQLGETFVSKRFEKGWTQTSVVEHFLGISEALGSTPILEKRNRGRRAGKGGGEVERGKRKVEGLRAQNEILPGQQSRSACRSGRYQTP